MKLAMPVSEIVIICWLKCLFMYPCFASIEQEPRVEKYMIV